MTRRYRSTRLIPDPDCEVCNGEGYTGDRDIAVFNVRDMELTHDTERIKCECLQSYEPDLDRDEE